MHDHHIDFKTEPRICQGTRILSPNPLWGRFLYVRLCSPGQSGLSVYTLKFLHMSQQTSNPADSVSVEQSVQRHCAICGLKRLLHDVQSLVQLFLADDNGRRHSEHATKASVAAEIRPYPQFIHLTCNFAR